MNRRYDSRLALLETLDGAMLPLSSVNAIYGTGLENAPPHQPFAVGTLSGERFRVRADALRRLFGVPYEPHPRGWPK